MNKLSLVENSNKREEKRRLPRFPFGHLSFRSEGGMNFEIGDLALEGMHLILKLGEHRYQVGDKVAGEIIWGQDRLKLEGVTRWCKENSLGVKFSLDPEQEKKLKNFCSPEKMITHLKKVSEIHLGVEMPANLSLWLKADAPLEIFGWEHSSGGFSRFQLLIFDQVIEWEDGLGLSTGKILAKETLETPLHQQNELTLVLDRPLNSPLIQLGHSIIEKIPSSLLRPQEREFLLLKLGS